MKKIKVHNLDNLKTCNYKQLNDLQGDFKDRTQTQIEQLANRIIEVGYLYPAYVWEDNKNKLWKFYF